MRVSHFRTLASAAWAVGVLGLSSAASAAPFAVGDVFASVGGGIVQVYAQDGTFKQTLNTGLGGFTTGSTFDAAGNFYVTAFSANQVSKFDSNGVLVDATWANGVSLNESIVFDQAGNAYIGNAGSAQITKVSSTGTFISNTAVLQNTDWIDLAADQVTVLYSNEGPTIRQKNMVTLVDTVFATQTGRFFAKRYIAGGGVLAANDNGNIYKFNADGSLAGTCNAGIGALFALNLDSDGTSVWTGTLGGQAVRKVNIASIVSGGGACVSTQAWNATGGGNQLFGLSVFGEIQQGGGNTTTGGNVPEPTALSMLGLALAAAAVVRRRMSA